MIRVAQMKLVAVVVAVVVTAGGGVIAMNQLMAQPDAPQASPIVLAAGPTSQPGNPASAPAPAAARNIRADTPKDAIRMFAEAVRSTDVEAMKQLSEIKDPREEKLLLAACDYTGALNGFFEAVKDKFGEQPMMRLRQGMQLNIFDSFIKDIEIKGQGMNEKIEGKLAILTVEGEDGDMRLTQGDDGGWRLSATGMTQDWTKEKFAEVLGNLEQGTTGLSQLTKEINDGQFNSFPELANTLRERFQRGK